jgi:tetratricopeptide (TPR) repeat protein
MESNQSFWATSSPTSNAWFPSSNASSPTHARSANGTAGPLVPWGVELQRSGLLEEAAHAFTTAARLNPDNLVAKINRNTTNPCSQNNPARVELSQVDEERFGPRFRTWDGLLAANGPVDEPGFCFRVGQLMIGQSLYRQAAHQFARTLELEPDNVPARFWLGSVYLSAGLHQKVLDTAVEIRANNRAPNNKLNSPDSRQWLALVSASSKRRGDPAAGPPAISHRRSIVRSTGRSAPEPR